ncbi:atypical MEK-related kinase (incomplete catalytic triad) [Cryptosporidium felis]|nr:atypical MEK-related kinase (incomplete catalytic triad) [Cryptosporidium felis]
MMSGIKETSESVFGRLGYLWVLAGNKAREEDLGAGEVRFCLNNYAYDSSKEGFLGEGSFFRAFRATKLFSFNKDSFENVLRTLKIGLISCLKSHKVLLSKGENSKIVLSVYERVILEFLIMSKLNHKSVPRVFGLLEIPEINQLVVVQEYLPFQLMYWDRRSQIYSAERGSKRPLVYGEKVSLMIFGQLVACLEYLHRQGVVHRDIKPENIFLTKKVQGSDLIITDHYPELDLNPEEDSENSSESSEDGFEDRCAWFDSPIYESVLEAKIEQERIFSDALELSQERQVEIFLGEGARLRSVDQILSLKEYRDFFQKTPDFGDSEDPEILVKLSDFNSSVVVDESRLIFDSDFGSDINFSSEGSLLFTPPECFKLECTKNGVDGFKRDIWSLGCVLYCMLNGRPPFLGRDAREFRRIINESAGDPVFPRKDVSEGTKELVRGMLLLDPDKRLSLAEVSVRLRKRLLAEQK